MKKRTTPSLSQDRLSRLYRILGYIETTPRSRDWLKKKFKLDQRTFYRDLNVLRNFGITIHSENDKYVLKIPLTQAQNLLPFPDPILTLEEAEQLAKGNTLAHKKLKTLIEKLLRPSSSRPSSH
jgi:predicted DNA-binding transcriptional regulator YafY